MAPVTTTRTTGLVEVRGLQEALAALGVFVQPSIFNKMIEVELRAAAQAVIVPAIQKEAPIGPSPHKSAARGKRGKKGPLAKTVTVISGQRRYRRNSTEFAAVNVGPRAWYRHFVIQGTQPHTLRGPKGTYRMDGHGTAKVPPKGLAPWHPGGRPNDFVNRAVQGKDAPLTAALGQVPVKEYARRLGKRITP
jgi:hypothetical protein